MILPNGHKIKIGLMGIADHYPEWASSNSKQKEHNYGINYVNISSRKWGNIFQHISTIKSLENINILVVYLHWGGNWITEPSDVFQEFAHRLVDAGVDVVAGTSPHILQRMEIYTSDYKQEVKDSAGNISENRNINSTENRNTSSSENRNINSSRHQGIIFYSLGDFIDDYAIDEKLRNDLGVIVRVVFCNNPDQGSTLAPARPKFQSEIKQVELFPTIIENMRVRLLHYPGIHPYNNEENNMRKDEKENDSNEINKRYRDYEDYEHVIKTLLQ